MDIFQIILLLNLCISVSYFIMSMIILKASGISPIGKRVKTKNKFGTLSIIISTLFYCIICDINLNVSVASTIYSLTNCIFFPKEF